MTKKFSIVQRLHGVGRDYFITVTVGEQTVEDFIKHPLVAQKTHDSLVEAGFTPLTVRPEE